MAWRHRGLLLIAAAVSLSTGAGAQRVRFGSHGGLTFARITELDPTRAFGGFPFSRADRIGAQAGVFATLHMRNDWSLQPEVNYTQKGVRVETSFAPVDGGPATIDIGVDYVEIPVLVRLDAARNRPWHPFLVAGPQLGIRVRCQTDLATGGSTFSSRCAAPDATLFTIDTPFTRTEVAGVAGLGVTGPLGRRRLYAQLRYARSVRTISPDAEAPLSPKHAGLAILFGLGF
ncbi:MAG: porin family protein [Gemmatimonadota bacterium]|nr:porin family protein [Gemmatimonadota bacterium]